MNCQSNLDFTILAINSEAKWKAQRLAVNNLAIREDGLTLRSFFEYAFSHVIGKPEGLVEPTDLAVDRCGTLFILDGRQSRMARYDAQQDSLEWIDCIGGVGDLPTQWRAPQAIALTDRTLYVADTGNHRVVAFARINWQIRWLVAAPPETLASPPEPALTPCDLAVDENENLYVLDCANLLIQKFDAGGRLVHTIGKGLLSRPVTIAIDNTGQGDLPCLLQHLQINKNRQHLAEMMIRLLATTYNKLSQPEREEFNQVLATVAIGTFEERLQALRERLLKGEENATALVASRLTPFVAKNQTFLYVLDAGLMEVLKFNTAGEFLGVAVDLRDSGLVDPFGLAVDEQGNLYIGERRDLARGEDEERFIYKFDAAGKFLGPPITAYRGRTDSLVIDQKFNLYVLDGEREDITLLTVREKFPPQGYFISTAFDSTIDDCHWHKLVVDAGIPEKTRIRVSFYVAATRQTDAEILSLPERAWRQPLLNPQDALLSNAIGRYLWLRLELAGDQQAAPALHSVKVYFQRLSYLRYLPAVYQEDEGSRLFLERFLALFETFFHHSEVQIGQQARWFDPLATRDDFLPWLSQWLAATFDQNWPRERQRQFLQRAATLYKARGTRQGFEALIELFTNEKPIIFESFQWRCIEDEKLLALYQQIFGKEPFHFCVLLKPGQAKTEGQFLAIKRLVDDDKPGHTAAGVRQLLPWFYLNMHTYLGVNTHLQKAEARVGQQSVISRDTLLGDIREAGQVERRSRLAMDTILT